jgi:beta-glucuronidase
MYERHIALVRSLDSSRPVSFATHLVFKDICLDLADIVSFNTYPRWYHDNDPRENYDAIRKWAVRNGAAGKPVLITETGAGGLYGFRDPTHDKWTEERQAEIVQEALLAYQNVPEIAGVFLWQFADIRVSEENGWPIRRPRTRNNKGLMDEYRRPKLVYDTVRRLWNGR